MHPESPIKFNTWISETACITGFIIAHPYATKLAAVSSLISNISNPAAISYFHLVFPAVDDNFDLVFRRTWLHNPYKLIFDIS